MTLRSTPQTDTINAWARHTALSLAQPITTMSKRSNGFERRVRDFYVTPAKAVLPLIPFLRAARIRKFSEPCAGDGVLVRHLGLPASSAPMPAMSPPGRTLSRSQASM
jgi:hypothetical protein